jgi:hypothetical protein
MKGVRCQQKMSNEKEKIVLRDLLLLFILVAIMALPIAIAEEVPAHVVMIEQVRGGRGR